MNPTFYDRRRSVSTTTGTGNFTLVDGTGAYSPISFTLLDTAPFIYTIAAVGGTEWETGEGHLSEAGILVRDYVLDSSDGIGGVAAQVDFAAGDKEVFISFPAAYLQGVKAVTEGGFPNAGIETLEETTDDTPAVTGPQFNGFAAGITGVYEVTVIATTAAGDAKSWRITYMAIWDDPTYTMYGKVVEDIAETSALTWDVDASIDGVNHRVTLTGAAATTITWRVFGGIKALVPAA